MGANVVAGAPVVPEPVAVPSAESMVTPEVVEAPVVTPDAPVITPNVSIDTPDVSVSVPDVAPVNNVSMEMPTITPEVVNSVDVPSVDVPSVEPLATSDVTPTITPIATPEPVVQAAPEPVIYGGANPTVSNINVDQEPHQIYGGANPLENTQSVPISSIAGPNATQQVQTPVAEPTLVAPQIEPIQVQNIQQ